MNALFAFLLIGALGFMAWAITRYILPALESRFGLRLSSGHVAALLAIVGVSATTARNFAQSTIDIEIDLSNFWLGFNQFFAALFPPMAFIASISAALGFIFLIVRALKNAFGSAT